MDENFQMDRQLCFQISISFYETVIFSDKLNLIHKMILIEWV